MGRLHENGWFWVAVGVVALIVTANSVAASRRKRESFGDTLLSALFTPLLVFGVVIAIFLVTAFLDDAGKKRYSCEALDEFDFNNYTAGESDEEIQAARARLEAQYGLDCNR